jgi:hypothetical protein
MGLQSSLLDLDHLQPSQALLDFVQYPASFSC